MIDILPFAFGVVGLFFGCLLLASMSFVNTVDPDDSPDSPIPCHGVLTAAEQIVPRAASQDSPEMLWPASPDLFTDGAGI
jgi:hypothetical protein